MNHNQECLPDELPDRVTAAESDRLPYSLPVELVVHDRETIAAICRHNEGPERDEFVKLALRIGVLAASQAQGEIDSRAIRQEATRMLEQVDSKLNEHSLLVGTRLKELLASYFDPQSGQLQHRLTRLLDQDGELETILKKQVGAENSLLTAVLNKHIGPQSELMKSLDPQHADSVVTRLREIVNQQLANQNQQIQQQFSLDNKEGALHRFLNELREKNGQNNELLTTRIDELQKQFSLDDEQSALSRLVRNVDSAQKKIQREFSLDHDQSSLMRLKRELTDMMKAMDEKNGELLKEIQLSVQAMQTRKKEAEKSTKGGDNFEDALAAWLDYRFQNTSDVVQRTGNKVGAVGRRIVGDFVIELGPDHKAAGKRIVVEAKSRQNYRMSDALDELKIARKNREADFGLFVFEDSKAPEDLSQPVVRIGQDIFCRWDAENPVTDIYLQSALTIALALVAELAQQSEDDFDWNGLRQSIVQIEQQADKFEKMDKLTSTIRNNGEKLSKQINSIREDLKIQVAALQKLLVQEPAGSLQLNSLPIDVKLDSHTPD